MSKALIFILIILLFEIPHVSSYTPSDIEWASAIQATLYKGNNFTNGPYTVLAAEFPTPVRGFKNFKDEIIPETPVSPMVYLEIYKNSTLMKEVVLRPESPIEIDPDYEVKVTLTNILDGNSRDWVDVYYNPWATVSISLRGKPKLEVKVTTDKTDYVSNTDDIMTATVQVTNTGDAVARNVDVGLNPGVLQLRGGSTSQFHHNYLELKKGETQSFPLIFLVPKVATDTSYTLNLNAKGYDVKNLEYQASGSLEVQVSPKAFSTGISVSKSIKKMISLEDTVLVRITVSNGGSYDVHNLRLTDSLNENFKLKFDSPLYWENSEILSGQDWSETYSLKPVATNLDGFAIPAANVVFTINNKEYNASSDSPSVIVNGPKIILNKTIDKKTLNISEDITITVSVNNVGNMGTRTQVVDYLPENVSLVSGQTSIDAVFLEVNKPQVFSYVMRPINSGTIELPAAVANYTNIEYRGTVRSALSSNRTMINVIDPNKINTSINLNTTGTISNLTPADGQIPVTLPDTTPSTGTTPEKTPINSPEITPTPITPFIDTALTVFLLIFTAFLRRK
ncbi:MAG: BatD family protein [Candidatus Methanoperedens sp.]|nr:BatD family protein [Candidatus Methanoperedens sp.]